MTPNAGVSIRDLKDATHAHAGGVGGAKLGGWWCYQLKHVSWTLLKGLHNTDPTGQILMYHRGQGYTDSEVEMKESGNTKIWPQQV